MVSEATALPTEPHPCPAEWNLGVVIESRFVEVCKIQWPTATIKATAKMQKLIQFGCAEDTILYLYFGG